MFENEGILMSMNMAKWQIWLACLSDLTVYTGGLIAHRTSGPNQDIQALLSDVIDERIIFLIVDEQLIEFVPAWARHHHTRSRPSR